MKREDEIKTVKADIRRLITRKRYEKNAHAPTYHSYAFYRGYDDAIATLEKYLAKIERKT